MLELKIDKITITIYLVLVTLIFLSNVIKSFYFLR